MVDPSLCQDLRTDWEWNSDTVVKANGFLSQFRSSTFLIAFNIVLEVFACLRGLTVKLQGKAADVAFAYKEVGETVKRFEKIPKKSLVAFLKKQRTLVKGNVSVNKVAVGGASNAQKQYGDDEC